ncbi:MAG: polynucleotide kinase-phosphatase [Candidatus Kapaibacterium sp.]
MQITIPEFSLVILIGTSGSGKSTFARKHFKETEVISSDACRAIVSDDENNMEATNDAFELLHYIVAKRLKRKMLTVVDATNVQPEARKPLIALAREYHCLPVAIVLDIPERICQDRNEQRADRNLGPHVIRNQGKQLRRSFKGIKKEGIRFLYRLTSQEGVDETSIERTKLWTDKRDETGPFDIVGDLHGCCTELEELLEQLGYVWEESEDERVRNPIYNRVYSHPEGRKGVFVGDLVDRGPRSLETLFLVRNMVLAGKGICVPGNHDVKFLKKLQGRNVQVKHGLERTVAEVERLSEEDRQITLPMITEFLDSLVSHYELDGGKLVVAHAGMREEMIGRASGRVRDFALFGETTGETDEFGLPVRYNWARDYRGAARIVYGHTPVPQAEWLNNTINIDTGCVFGGALTALRYPELLLVPAPAREIYSEPIRPIESSTSSGSAEREEDTLLDIEDVIGKRIVNTSLMGGITIRAENSAAALEVMSRFAVDPRWLIYLPPTMSPVSTSTHSDYLERPEEGFSYYRGEGVAKVICEEKHMGSRAVVVLCRDGDVAKRRFGVSGVERGVIYTRTGRRFFNDQSVERGLLDRLGEALTATGFWQDLNTDWVCLDCELMPWSAKAQELLRDQYAAVGSSATYTLLESIKVIGRGVGRGLEVSGLLDEWKGRIENISRYVDAYRHYCWPVEKLEDFRLAPFHILATEGAVHFGKDHGWHMEQIAKFSNESPPLFTTAYRVIDLNDPEEVKGGIEWWEELTGKGGEGMVVKPFDFMVQGEKFPVQPAVKVRGREYLRIIYGPEYTVPEHLERLRSRGLAKKRSLASREFALGKEGLEAFVQRAPLRKVHECVFGVLALESEPVDPRL